MFPRNENRNEGTFGCSPKRKPERGYVCMFPRNGNRHIRQKPPFWKTTLLSTPEFLVFQDACCSNKENPSVYWHLALSCPLMASNNANWYPVLISFRSRSGADLSLDFFGLVVSYLVLQACISVYRVSDISGALLFCLVRIKCR